MAKIKEKFLSFPPSDSPDVVEYKLYYVPSGTTLNYDAPFINLGSQTSDINLGGFTELAGLDSIYDLGVVAVDDVGNESDMSVATDVPLDFTAPSAPGSLVIQ